MTTSKRYLGTTLLLTALLAACEGGDNTPGTGSVGDVGATGPQGETGPRGEPGALGPIGPQGVPGAIGSQGDPGLAGAMGQAGANGQDGAIGAQGVPGPSGATGSQGVQGVPGVAGASGPQGTAGAAGSAGSAGPQGIAGPQGDPGPSGTLTGDVFIIPGFGGAATGGYLSLVAASGRSEFSVYCNYGGPGANGASWFAGFGVTAGDVTIIHRVDGEPIDVFSNLQFNQGAQDQVTQAGTSTLTYPWHAIVIANDGGELTRYDLTVTGSSTGNCTVIVYGLGDSTATIQHP